MKMFNKLTILAALFVASLIGMSCKSENGWYMIHLGASRLNFDGIGGTQNVKLYFTNDWSVETNDGSWVTITPNRGAVRGGPNTMDSILVTFVAPANTTGKERVESINFISKNSSHGIRATQTAQ